MTNISDIRLLENYRSNPKVNYASFCLKYNSTYMDDKKWQEEAVRTDAPCLKVVTELFGKEQTYKWAQVHVCTLSYFGGSNISDDSQLAIAKEIINAYGRWGVPQFVAFFQWYRRFGETYINGMNVMKCADRYNTECNKLKHDHGNGSLTTDVIVCDYSIPVLSVESMETYTLDRLFDMIPKGTIVGVESGDCYMIAMEYYRRHCVRDILRFFDGWQSKVMNHLNGICDYMQTDCKDLVRVASIDEYNAGNTIETDTPSRSVTVARCNIDGTDTPFMNMQELLIKLNN